ncbi:MAG: protein-L-isoaspartate O-methyltransferase family protein [bacterium]
MDFTQARKNMVDSQIRPNDVPQLDLQLAFERISREDFVPTNKRDFAYAEMEIPLLEGRKLLRARDHAKLLQIANIRNDHLVLDMACGYGYSTAIIAQIAGMVVGLEADEDICAKAEQRLSPLELDNAAILCGPLVEGRADQGPYDRIIINGVVEYVPEALLQQLKPEGHLAAIVRQNEVSEAQLYTRSGDAFGAVTYFEAAAQEPLAEFTKSAEFTF